MHAYPTTLFDLIERGSLNHGAKTAVISGNDRLTYQELSRAVIAAANFLLESGVTRRQRVGIHVRKSIDEIVLTFAIASVGAVFVNINYQSTTRQIWQIVDDCDIELLFSDKRKIRQLVKGGAEERHGLSLIAIPLDHKNSAATPPGRRKYAPVSNDLAALLYTSGSTGNPKGVMITHRQLLDGAGIVSSYLHLRESDVILSVPPLSFDYGLNQVLDAFLVGATLVLSTVNIPSETRNRSMVSWPNRKFM